MEEIRSVQKTDRCVDRIIWLFGVPYSLVHFDRVVNRNHPDQHAGIGGKPDYEVVLQSCTLHGV